MQEIHKNYVLDENQQPVAVQISIAEFEQIEEILENFGLAKLMEETGDEDDERLSKDTALKYYEEYPFAKELITDTEGHVRKVVIDFSDYQRLLELIEDEGLTLAMMEVKDETPLSLDEALAELEKE
jgi:type III secretion system FlhB-like substrate exporter